MSNQLLKTAAASVGTFATVDPVAPGALPESHRRALLLRDAGAEPGEIAAALDIVVEAVGPLLAVAEAKRAHVADDSATDVTADE